MKVNIEALRVLVNHHEAGHPFSNITYELNEALNELETRRSVERYCDETLREENRRLRADLARITQIKDNLIIAGDRMRDELTGRTETTSFKKWFKNLHPETIESVTITLRKKEN